MPNTCGDAGAAEGDWDRNSLTILWSEGLFRSFSNRMQLASLRWAGVTTLAKSGSVAHEQGVSNRQSAGCERR